jgi:hypothetical protein
VNVEPGARFGPYEIVAAIGAGGPASARARGAVRALWRGLAEAQSKRMRA